MNNYLLWKNTNRNETFSDFVCLKIRERQLNKVALYKSVDLSRDIFSKMFSNFFSTIKKNSHKILIGDETEFDRNRLFVEPCRLCFVNKFERRFSRPLLHFKRDL